MIISITHLLACLCLLAAAIAIRRGNSSAVPFLFPLILLSTATGIALIYLYAIEIFVANYSGAIYEMEVLTYRLNGPYWWVYYGSVILPLLPGLAFIPAIRKRLVLVAVLALIAAVPSAFWIWQDIAFG